MRIVIRNEKGISELLQYAKSNQKANDKKKHNSFEITTLLTCFFLSQINKKFHPKVVWRTIWLEKLGKKKRISELLQFAKSNKEVDEKT